MSLKRQLNLLKNGIVGETIRDYSDLTDKEDCVSAQLKRKSNQFRFELTCTHEEHGSLCFKIPLSPSILNALQDVINDIGQIRKGKADKKLRLRFRQGEFDLVVTYQFERGQSAQNQRTAPVTPRTYKMLEEMLLDAETILANQEHDNNEEWPD